MIVTGGLVIVRPLFGACLSSPRPCVTQAQLCSLQYTVLCVSKRYCLSLEIEMNIEPYTSDARDLDIGCFSLSYGRLHTRRTMPQGYCHKEQSYMVSNLPRVQVRTSNGRRRAKGLKYDVIHTQINRTSHLLNLEICS